MTDILVSNYTPRMTVVSEYMPTEAMGGIAFDQTTFLIPLPIGSPSTRIEGSMELATPPGFQIASQTTNFRWSIEAIGEAEDPSNVFWTTDCNGHLPKTSVGPGRWSKRFAFDADGHVLHQLPPIGKQNITKTFGDSIPYWFEARMPTQGPGGTFSRLEFQIAVDIVTIYEPLPAD